MVWPPLGKNRPIIHDHYSKSLVKLKEVVDIAGVSSVNERLWKRKCIKRINQFLVGIFTRIIFVMRFLGFFPRGLCVLRKSVDSLDLCRATAFIKCQRPNWCIKSHRKTNVKYNRYLTLLLQTTLKCFIWSGLMKTNLSGFTSIDNY